MGGTSPCASCKLLRRRCAKDCVFAPYFPPDDPHKFAIVHKVFGASNVSKMLQEIPVNQRGDAVGSLVYEANARMRDPVYGCVGAISYLQNQVSQLQMQLAVAQAEILCIQMQQQQQDQEVQEQDPTLTLPFPFPLPLPLPLTTTQIDSADDIHQKPLVFSANDEFNNNLQQHYYNFASSSSSSSSSSVNVMMMHQDPLKRESLWT